MRILVLALLLSLVSAGPAFAAEYALWRVEEPRCFVKGENAAKFTGAGWPAPAEGAPGVTRVHMDCISFIEDGRTFVQVRFLANALGVAHENVRWDGALRKVTLSEPGMPEIEMVVGRKTIWVDGKPESMDVAPQVVEPGRTMLPARHVAEALGWTVDWDGERRLVLCSRGGEVSFDDVAEELSEELAWWYLVGPGRNWMPVFPDPDRIGHGWDPPKYIKDSVKLWLNGSSGTVRISTCTPQFEGDTFGEMISMCREVVLRMFGCPEFTDRVMELVEMKDDWRTKAPPWTKLTAPDGRRVWVDDGGMGADIVAFPHGR